MIYYFVSYKIFISRNQEGNSIVITRLQRALISFLLTWIIIFCNDLIFANKRMFSKIVKINWVQQIKKEKLLWMKASYNRIKYLVISMCLKKKK